MTTYCQGKTPKVQRTKHKILFIAKNQEKNFSSFFTKMCRLKK